MDAGTSSAFGQFKELYHQGQYLQAYEVAKQFGPLQEWNDPLMQVQGGRLAHNLGADRLGRIMHRAAYRANPTDPETVYFYVLSTSARWGILKSWKFVSEAGDFEDAPVKIRSDWLALKAMTFAKLRDFETAERYMEKALSLNSQRAWLHVCQTGVLEQQDRTEEALAAAERAIELSPWYRPAVQNLAHSLVQQNRDDEALQLLRDGVSKLESGALHLQLGALLLELDLYDEARNVYEGVEKFFPLNHLEKKSEEWFAARQADAAYYVGDFAAAREHAKRVSSPVYETLVERFEGTETDYRRAVLPVRFVRQNHLTCAPATLSALSEFWEKPVEHLELAEEICFDGTPAHSERRWADSHGYVTREFRVTIETTSSLIDRGIPFTLTTIDPGSGHLQAVIGYDEYRQSLLIRNPGERHYEEFPIKEMLEAYAVTGPRGMVMVPEEKANLLDGIELPESEFYDLLHQVDLALESHRREDAERVVKEMCTRDTEHRLTLRARGNLAFYDGNTNEILSVVDAILEQFPDDTNTLMSKLGCLQELGRREERMALLEELIGKPDSDPIFWGRFASELADDAREYERASELTHRCIRHRPHEVAAYDVLASMLMEQQKHEEAIWLFRFAACIGEMNERHSQSYFYACRSQNQTGTALQFLKDRHDRFGKKSSQPTQTLCWALEQLDRMDDAFKILDQAYKAHKENGDFLLYLTAYCGRYGKFDQATKLLTKAKGICHETAWLRGDASLLLYRGELKKSLKQWFKVLEADPLDVGAHRIISGLLADTEGDQSAVDHLRKYVERFPHSYGLGVLLIDSYGEESSEERLQELNRFVKLNPADAWVYRELAFHRATQREYDKVPELVDRAEEIEPTHPSLEFLRGRVDRNSGNTEQAKHHFRKSIEQSVDYDIAILGLLDCCNSKAEREIELDFLFRELQKQVIFGDGLLVYQEHAAQTIDSDVLLERLEEAQSARSDLWQGWSAVIRQLSNMQRHEEAIKIADEATVRFPLLPRLWIDRSVACASCGDIDGEIESLISAKRINPGWGEPARFLAEAYEKKGDLDQARAEIERIIISEPSDVRNQGLLADLMWKQDQKQEAIEKVVAAVLKQPGYSWGWAALRSWADELKQRDMVIDITRKLTTQRPRDYRSWLLYAESLGEREQIDEAVAALDSAIAINPTNPDAYSQKAFQLTRAGRFDEALDATRPAALREQLPLSLLSRAAWIEGERGNIETAVSMMEKVIEQDQDYYWAWQRLAEWYEFLNRDKAYYKAAKQMVRLAPQDPVAWGDMGDAQLRLDERTAAKKSFQQAVQLSPAYSFGASQLVDLQLEDKEFDEAAATIDLVAPHIPPAWHLSEKLRIESLRGDKEASFELLKQLAVTPADDSSAIDSAVAALFAAKWGEEAMPLIDSLLDLEDAQPGVAYVFVNLSATLETWAACQKRLMELRGRPELYTEGVRKFLEEVSGDENEVSRFKAFVKKHRKELRANVVLWDAVGDAYNGAGQFKKCVAWMKDWQTHDELTPEYALTIALAYWHLKRPEDAIRVSRYVLSELEPAAAFGRHLTLTAFYELIYGSPEACIDAVGMVDPTQLNNLFQVIFQYIVTPIENLSTGQTYNELSGQLKALRESLPPELQAFPFFQWVHNLTAWRAATLHGRSIRAFLLKWKI